MLTKNEATWDRVGRIVLAIVLAGVGLGVVGGTAGTVMALVGLVPLITGLLGHCPLYSLTGVCTLKTEDASRSVPSSS